MTENLKRIEERIKFLRKYHNVPSVAIGIVDNGELADFWSFGKIKKGKKNIPDENTQFRIISMTKSFTAAAILALNEDGELNLDDPVSNHGVKLKHPDSPIDITIEHLLTMTSGLPTDDPWADRAMGMSPQKFDELIEEGFSFAHLPGVVPQYSNLGYGLLGRVISNITGASYQRYISDNILAPLRMDRTTWAVLDSNHARGYRKGENIEDYVESDGEIAAMGGLFSTVSDMAKWINFYLDPQSRGPLSSSSRTNQQSQKVDGPYLPVPGQYQYSYGLREISYDYGNQVSHPGGSPGYGCHMRWSSDKQVGAVGLGNSTYAPLSFFTRDVLKEYVGVNEFTNNNHLQMVEKQIERLIVLLNQMSKGQKPKVASKVVTDNFFQDETVSKRRTQLVDKLGKEKPIVLKTVTYNSASDVTLGLGAGNKRAEAQIVFSPHAKPKILKLELS